MQQAAKTDSLFTTMHGLHFSGSMMLKLPIQTI